MTDAIGGGGLAATVRLDTLGDTDALGHAIGRLLRAGDLVILSGALGAGKTALTKAIAAGMGVAGLVMSPTFVISRIHHSVRAGGVTLVHVDAYRLDGAFELDDLDLDTDLEAAAVVVEWGEGRAEQLSEDHLLVRLERMPDDSRVAELVGVSARWAADLEYLVGAVSSR